MQDGTILAVGPEHPCNRRRGKVSRGDSRQAYPGCRESKYPPSPGTAWQLQAASSSRSCVVLRPHGASSVRGRVPMRKEHCFLHPSAITHHPSGSWLPTPGRPSRSMTVGLFRASSSATNTTGWLISRYYCYCDYLAAYTGRSTLATFPLLFLERPTCIRGSSDMQRLLGLVRNERAHPQPPTSQRMIHDEQYYYYSASSSPASSRPPVLPTPSPLPSPQRLDLSIRFDIVVATEIATSSSQQSPAAAHNGQHIDPGLPPSPCTARHSWFRRRLDMARRGADSSGTAHVQQILRPLALGASSLRIRILDLPRHRTGKPPHSR